MNRGKLVINKRTCYDANGNAIEYTAIMYPIVTSYGGIDVNAIAIAHTQTNGLNIVCYSYSETYHTSIVNNGGYLYDTTNHRTLHDAIEQFNERVRYSRYNRVVFYGYDYNATNNLLPNELILECELNCGRVGAFRVQFTDDTNSVIDSITVNDAFVHGDSVAVRVRLSDLTLHPHTHYRGGAFGSGRYEYIPRDVHTDNSGGE